MNFPVANIHIHSLTMLLYCKCYVVIVIVCFLVQVKYLEFARECIPTKAITIHDRDKPWFNSGI